MGIDSALEHEGGEPSGRVHSASLSTGPSWSSIIQRLLGFGSLQPDLRFMEDSNIGCGVSRHELSMIGVVAERFRLRSLSRRRAGGISHTKQWYARQIIGSHQLEGMFDSVTATGVVCYSDPGLRTERYSVRRMAAIFHQRWLPGRF